MGVETALVVGGATLAGNYLSGRSQADASKRMARATDRATQASIEMQQEGMDRGIAELEKYSQAGQGYLSPYSEAGKRSLGTYQQMLTPEGQASFAEDYTKSPIYQSMLDQATKNTLKGASATGGLRTGQANVAMQSIAPQLIQNAIGQRLQGLQGLVNMGQQTAGQRAQLASNMGGSTSNLIAGTMGNMANTTQQGQIASANYGSQANAAMPMALGNTLGQLGGMYGAYKMYQGG